MVRTEYIWIVGRFVIGYICGGLFYDENSSLDKLRSSRVIFIISGPPDVLEVF